jgi:hypothetical protein
VCVVVGRRVIAPARVTSGCGARRRHGRASCWRAARMPSAQTQHPRNGALPASCHRAQCTATLWRHSGTLAQTTLVTVSTQNQAAAHRSTTVSTGARTCSVAAALFAAASVALVAGCGDGDRSPAAPSPERIHQCAVRTRSLSSSEMSAMPTPKGGKPPYSLTREPIRANE